MEPQQQATCEGDLTINARGGKYVPLRRNGGPPVWQSAEWQKIIWHPAAFNDPTAKRVGLCLEPDEASTAQLQEIEQHLVRALTALSLSEPKIFGKFLTEGPLPIVPENEPARRLVPQAEAGLGASPHLGAQPGGAGGARRVAEEDPPLERQALAGGVGDGVAQPGVLQEGGVGEGVAAVQDDLEPTSATCT